MNVLYDLIIWIYTHTGNFDTVIFALPAIILMTLIYWSARLIWHRRIFGGEYRTIRKKARLNENIRLLTFCWFCALLCMVLTPTEFWMRFWINILNGEPPVRGVLPEHFGEVDLMPKVLKYVIEGHLDWLWWSAGTVFTHLFLNILLFVPLGTAMPFVYRKATFANTVLTGFSLSLIVECVQFFLGRECEMDDLICNTLGAAAGYILYLLIRKIFPGFTEKCRLSVYQVSKNQPNNVT